MGRFVSQKASGNRRFITHEIYYEDADIDSIVQQQEEVKRLAEKELEELNNLYYELEEQIQGVREKLEFCADSSACEELEEQYDELCEKAMCISDLIDWLENIIEE